MRHGEARPDTKARIQAVARELFVEQGVQNTSLQQIADRLGITKPALYYHFASRDELVSSIIQPLLDEEETIPRGPGGAGRGRAPRPCWRATSTSITATAREWCSCSAS